MNSDLSINPRLSDPAAAQPGDGLWLTVAVCTRNRAGLMREAVESVLRQIDARTEILIVDNASTDETSRTATELQEKHPARVAVVGEERLGLSVARNTALARARGEFVVFLDDDAVAEPGWLQAYREFLAGASSPRIACAGGPVSPRYEAPPPAWMPTGENTYEISPEPMRFAGRAGPWGCNFAVDRAVALKLGGFDPALGRSGAFLGAHEESDLYQRLSEAGYESWWVPGARIQHWVPAMRTSFQWNFHKEFQQGRTTATVRLGRIGCPGWRLAYALVRLLAVPLEVLVALLVAGLTFPFKGGRLAVRALFKVARAGGFACQILRGTPSPSG